MSSYGTCSIYLKGDAIFFLFLKKTSNDRRSPCDLWHTKKHDMIVGQLAGSGVLLGWVFPGVQPVVFLRVRAVVNLYQFSFDIFFQIQGRVTPEHSKIALHTKLTNSRVKLYMNFR